MNRDDIIKRYQTRRDSRLEERMDGGEGSGNWGHVGRIGKRGGSEPGGGKAFRMEKTTVPKSNANYGKTAAAARAAKASGDKAKAEKAEEKRQQASKYISRKQKVTTARKNLTKANAALAKANASGDQKKITKATKQVTTAQKRLTKLNTTQKSVKKLTANGTFDPQASKNILNDPSRGKTTTKDNARGTKEEMSKLYASANKKQTGNGTPPAKPTNPAATTKTPSGASSTGKQAGGNTANGNGSQKATPTPTAATPTQTPTPTAPTTPAPAKSKWQQEHDDAIDRQKALVNETEANKIAAVNRAIADCGNRSSVKGGADTLYQHFQDSLRLDSAPRVVSQDEFDNEPGTTMYRTINANDQSTLHSRVNNSIYDKKTVYSTWSAYGTGIYAASHRRDAASYGDTSRESAMMSFKPTKDAKMITEKAIDREINKVMASGSKMGALYQKISKMYNNDGREALRGIHAQLNGYDGMICGNGYGGRNYFVIYNRSNFIASDTVAYTPRNKPMKSSATKLRVTRDKFGA